MDDFDDAVARAGELGAEVVIPPHRNPPEGQPGGPAHRELWIRDPDGYGVVVARPDGYGVVVASPDGEAARPSYRAREVAISSRCSRVHATSGVTASSRVAPKGVRS